MKYPGKELEIFDKAIVWRKYIHALTKRYLKDNILEIGAGFGSFTKSYSKNSQNIILTDLDEENIKILKKNFSEKKNMVRIFHFSCRLQVNGSPRIFNFIRIPGYLIYI